jgi:hypothetical protein
MRMSSPLEWVGHSRRRERMDVKLKALGATIGLALLLASPAGAYANTVAYSGNDLEGEGVGIGFKLHGKKCPKGPKCFKKAKLQKFEAVPYSQPNCPDVLDTGVFDTEDVKVKKNRKFDGSAVGQDPSGYDVDVTLKGRFKKKGKSVLGTFTATLNAFGTSCSSGVVPWKATPDEG